MITGLTLVMSMALLVQATPQTGQPAAKASISGMVTHSGTGDPIPGVRVTIARTTDLPATASAFLEQMSANGEGPPTEVAIPVEFFEKKKAETAIGNRGGPLDDPGGGNARASAEAAFWSTLPAENAQSILLSPDGRVSFIPKGAAPALTDGGGRFSFRNLEPGAYRLIFAANGFVRQDYGQRIGAGPGSPIVLTAGQEVAGLAMRLTPTGAISGRITDPMGQPVSQAPVQLARLSYDASARKQVKTVAATQTDDRGEYRFYFLTPGRYYLSAGGGPITEFTSLEGAAATITSSGFAAEIYPGVPSSIFEAPNRIAKSYGLTFYPSAPDPASAASIEVTPGADLAGIDIAVTPQRYHTVRGWVVDPVSGRPPQSASVAVIALDETVGGAPEQRYNATDGIFELRHILPGSYTLVAQLPDWSPGSVPEPDEAALRSMSPAERQRYFQAMEAAAINAEAQRPRAMAFITVGDGDVDGVILRIGKGTSISGRIRLEGVTAGRAPALNGVRVELVSPAPQLGWQPQQSLQPDGGFRIDGVPSAEYRLRVTGLPPGFYVKSATFGELDALGAPIVLPTEKASALNIVISAGVGQIEGTVTGNDGQPAPGLQVILIPDRNRDRPELYRAIIAGTNGQFRMVNITPGNYHAVAWDFLEPYGYFDPALIQQAEEQGKSISVGESSKQTADVRALAR